jgi:hypothetical protein
MDNGPARSRPIAALPISAMHVNGRGWERDAHELDDAALARLIKGRLQLDRMQGWMVLGTIVVLCLGGLIAGVAFHSTAVLFAVATLAASLGVCAGFLSERVLLAWFMSDGRAAGLSDQACLRLFERAPSAAKVVDVLASVGREPSDAELAGFVR